MKHSFRSQYYFFPLWFSNDLSSHTNEIRLFCYILKGMIGSHSLHTAVISRDAEITHLENIDTLKKLKKCKNHISHKQISIRICMKASKLMTQVIIERFCNRLNYKFLKYALKISGPQRMWNLKEILKFFYQFFKMMENELKFYHINYWIFFWKIWVFKNFLTRLNNNNLLKIGLYFYIDLKIKIIKIVNFNHKDISEYIYKNSRK